MNDFELGSGVPKSGWCICVYVIMLRPATGSKLHFRLDQRVGDEFSYMSLWKFLMEFAPGWESWTLQPRDRVMT